MLWEDAAASAVPEGLDESPFLQAHAKKIYKKHQIMILAFFNVPVWIQWVVFLVMSTVLLIIAFKFLRKILLKNHGNKKTDTDILIGMVARVEEDINNAEMQGAVKVDGKIWSARMVDDSETAQKGEFVVIEYISGVKLMCARKK